MTSLCRPIRIAMLAMALVAVPGVTPGTAAAEDAQSGSDPRESIALVLEEGQSSAALRAGAEDAAAESGMTIHIQPVTGERSRQLAAIQRLRNAPGIAGVAVAVRDPTVVREAIEALVATGFPVVIVRHGLDAWERLGASAFVGQDESQAGSVAGRRLAELGASRAICVRDVALEPIQEARCQGAARELMAAGAELQTLFALDPPGDPTGVRDAITARLVSDPDIDAILATEEDGLAAAIDARERASRPDVVIATFEPDANVIADIEAGRLAFAVDQQPYIQGYLAVVTLGLAAGSDRIGDSGSMVVIGPRVVPGPEA